MRGFLVPELGPVALPDGDAEGYADRLDHALPGHDFAVREAELVEIAIPYGMRVVMIQLGMWWDMAAQHDRKQNSRMLAQLLLEAGAFPLMVPPALGIGLEELLGTADHLLMPGGDDLHPVLYGHSVTHSVGLSLERDLWDMMMVQAAKAAGMKITAICRGIDVVNAVLGGTVTQDVNLDGRTKESHAGTEHDVITEKGSQAEALLGRTVRDMVSRHHQEIALPGRGLEVTGRSPDGLIEIMEGLGIMCYQFHPENTPESRQSRMIFREMVRR